MNDLDATRPDPLDQVDTLQQQTLNKWILSMKPSVAQIDSVEAGIAGYNSSTNQASYDWQHNSVLGIPYNIESSVYGGGLIGWLGQKLAGRPAGQNGIDTLLKTHIGGLINNIQVAKEPVNSALTGSVNVLTNGNLNKNSDKFFHTSLLIKLSDGYVFKIEKNEAIKVTSPVGPYKSGTSMMQVPLSKPIPLGQFIEKAQSSMGKDAFFQYSALQNNCQDFIIGLLRSNGLLTPTLQSFIKQDISSTKDNGFAKTVTDGLTDTGANIKLLFGGSIKKDNGFDKTRKKIYGKGVLNPNGYGGLTLRQLNAYPDYKPNETFTQYAQRTGITDRNVIMGKYFEGLDQAADNAPPPADDSPDDPFMAFMVTQGYIQAMNTQVALSVASLAMSYINTASSVVSKIIDIIPGADETIGIAFNAACKGLNALSKTWGISDDQSNQGIADRVVAATEVARKSAESVEASMKSSLSSADYNTFIQGFADKRVNAQGNTYTTDGSGFYTTKPPEFFQKKKKANKSKK